ncbi:MULTISPECIES: AbgT family transporter [Corynebacterium]|nr:AbgT family transporter [Corynebacterium afermentans]
MGTLMSRLIVFTVVFWLFWVVLLFIWYQFDLPLGPGASIMLAS